MKISFHTAPALLVSRKNTGCKPTESTLINWLHWWINIYAWEERYIFRVVLTFWTNRKFLLKVMNALVFCLFTAFRFREKSVPMDYIKRFSVAENNTCQGDACVLCTESQDYTTRNVPRKLGQKLWLTSQLQAAKDRENFFKPPVKWQCLFSSIWHVKVFPLRKSSEGEIPK